MYVIQTPSTGAIRSLALALLLALAVGATPSHAQDDRDSKTAPQGDEKSAKTQMLELGAKVLQGNAPLGPFDIYLVGFHPMKDDPESQMEAHHFCAQVNQDFAQCVLFDANTASANLNGIEYIISEQLMESLPAQERQYWHPHNGEILSGQLIAPGIPAPAEQALMKSKMNSYGKTWHVWNTGHEGMAPDKLPLGPARLAWSFNRDGEAKPALVEKRDQALGVSTHETRENRGELEALAQPQYGVDALKGKFKRPTQDIPGVVDRMPK